MPPMGQIPKILSKNRALLSVHCVLLMAFISWILFGLTPIQESMAPFTFSLDCLHCFAFKLDTLCSNSAFLLLLCNAIIGTLMALSKSSESPDIYTLYFKESETRRKQFGGFAEASSKGKKWVPAGTAEISGFTEICSVEKLQQVEIDGDEKCMWASSNLAVVPYQGDISNEELNKKCDQFITGFRRQLILEHEAYTPPY